MIMEFSAFETEIFVRPDDIDMNNHVHYSKYLDYLLTARYIQMKKNYGMSMESFLERGFTWVASTININYKRAIMLGDKVIVRAQITGAKGAQVFLNYWILKGENKKIAAEGNAVFTMISTKNGRPVRIPPDILEKYSI
jgi:acyl-CoA thioester hydrolase/thioesterase-3